MTEVNLTATLFTIKI